MKLRDLASEIRRIREEKNLSRVRLGVLSKTHDEVIGLIERGKRPLTLKTLDRLAEALGYEVIVTLEKKGQLRERLGTGQGTRSTNHHA